METVPLLFSMKKWFLLVVRCNRDKLHVFVDSDPEYKVLDLNNNPRSHKHLWKHRPIWLVAKWSYPTRKAARWSSKAFKKLSKTTKLELIEEGWQLEAGTFVTEKQTRATNLTNNTSDKLSE